MAERDLAAAAAHVQDILVAAEEAAEQLRLQAERRMQARIAEGQRSAELRVQAAEAEALEILGAAQEQAEKMLAEAHAAAEESREAAQREAREIVAEASGSAREVLRDGTELSGHLRELSESLRANSELLLRDIRLAHAEMTARLDQVSPAPAADTLDVPEFHPGRR